MLVEEVKRKPWRPRTHDREQVAMDLIEWAEKDDSLNLCGFCAEQYLPPENLSIWANQSDDFRKAYVIAKMLIAKRREIKLSEGKLHTKAYDLNAATYDHFLKKERREEIEFEAKMKSELGKEIDPEAIKHYLEVKSLLASRRSDLKIEDKSINKEQ